MLVAAIPVLCFGIGRGLSFAICRGLSIVTPMANKMKVILYDQHNPAMCNVRGERMQRWEDGLKAHGVQVERVRFGDPAQFGDVIISWGVRSIEDCGHRALRHLVMECGFLGNRLQNYYLGWSRLNGEGRLCGPVIAGRGERWYGDLKPARGGRMEHGRVAILGQVHSDSSMFPLSTATDANKRHHMPKDIARWYEGVASLCRRRGAEIAWRGHPSDPIHGHASCPKGAINTVNHENDWGKAQLWEWADACVAFSSNSLVEAYMAGVDVIPAHPQAMVWPVRSNFNLPARHTIEQRRAWLDRVASYQWHEDEISSGAAWEYVLHGRAN